MKELMSSLVQLLGSGIDVALPSQLSCPLELWRLPFIICKFISVVVRGNNIHEKNVLRFGIKASHLHFVTRKHPPGRERERNTQRESGEGGVNANTQKSPL